MTLTLFEFWLFTSLVFSAGLLFGAGWAGRRREEEFVELFRQRASQKQAGSPTTPVLRLSTRGAKNVAESRERIR